MIMVQLGRRRPTMLVLLSTLMLISHGGVDGVQPLLGDDPLSANISDMLSLLDFKHAINDDPMRVLRSWNTGGLSHCQWKGVKCSLKHPGRVMELNLCGLNLSDPISPSLGNLTFLRNLNLSVNGFIGELPHLNRLHRLQVLDLSENSLQGIIPDTLTNCSKLERLWLFQNLLVGKIPFHMGLLPNLLELVLFSNNLTGSIPPSLKNISQLEYVFLNNNNLMGTIPNEIGLWPSLKALFLQENMLSDGIPISLFNHSDLTILDLSNNMLLGAIPVSFSNQSNLQSLDLSNNKLSGAIPVNLLNQSNLQYLHLSKNKLSGAIPVGLFIQSNLQVLDLSNNMLGKALPSNMGDMFPSLYSLLLDHNNFEDPIPDSLGNILGLQTLRLSFNNFIGQLP